MADEPYRVLWAPAALDAIREFGRNAPDLAMRRELARIAADLNERLSRDPISVGEVYRSGGVVEEHHAVLAFLAIDFAIDKQRKFVLVRSCTALSGLGL
jgi:hypothetical protein